MPTVSASEELMVLTFGLRQPFRLLSLSSPRSDFGDEYDIERCDMSSIYESAPSQADPIEDVSGRTRAITQSTSGLRCGSWALTSLFGSADFGLGHGGVEPNLVGTAVFEAIICRFNDELRVRQYGVSDAELSR